jgi:hypothetical protein
MKRFVSVIFIILISFACSSRPGDRGFTQKNTRDAFTDKKSSNLNESKTVSNDTNIHYNTKYCTECHKNYPDTPEIAKLNLKFNGDDKLLCKCHYESQVRDLHPVDIIPSHEIKVRIPSGFTLSDGKITCSTCHNISLQCKDIPKIYLRQVKFLRGGPYNSSQGQCFLCHDPDKFNRYNPHKQLDKDGNIITKTCLYCHPEVPDVKNRDNNAGLKLIENYTPLCRGCHIKTESDSLHDKHVRRPSAAVLYKIKETEKRLNVSLPLSDDGMVTCVTCHNPHEKTLIPGYRFGAIEAVQKTSSGFSGAICTTCHEMQ